MKTKIFLVPVLCTLSLVSINCKNTKESKEPTPNVPAAQEQTAKPKEDNPGTGTIATPAPTDTKTETATVKKDISALQKEAKLSFMSSGNEETPRTDVSVVFAGKTVQLDKVTGEANLIEKNEYASFKIPANAITACRSWWAGAGDYYYVVPTATGVTVFKGWQEEEQADAGYHWKKVKDINAE